MAGNSKYRGIQDNYNNDADDNSLEKGKKNTFTELRNIMTPAPTPTPTLQPQNAPRVRSNAEAEANYQQILNNFSNGQPTLSGVGQPGQMPAAQPPMPAAAPAAQAPMGSAATQAKMNALQQMGAQPQGRIELSGQGDMDSQVNQALSQGAKQAPVPQPVSGNQDPEILKAIQRARMQEQEDNE